MKPRRSCRVSLMRRKSLWFENISPRRSDNKDKPLSDPRQRSLKTSQQELPENILQGNGSDELIYYLVTTFGGPVSSNAHILDVWHHLAGARRKTIVIPLDKEFDINLDKTLKAIRKKSQRSFFCSPNNPTGNCFSSIEL